MNDATADKLNERTPSVAKEEHREKGTALLIVDMIGKFDHEDGPELFKHSLPAAANISRLKQRAVEAGVPVIYVNDNYGEWRNDFRATLQAANRSELGRQIVDLIQPGPDDYHILKPQRSGFFSTPLDVLLATLKVSRLILTGAATDICILATAHDAYMRGFELVVPGDCTAAVSDERKTEVLDLLTRIVDADTRPSTHLDLPKTQHHKSLSA